MAISKDKKTAIVKSLKEDLKDAGSAVFVNFHGLSVKESTDLRRALKKENCSYTVAKKTLIRRVLDEVKPEGELPALEGEIAVSTGRDATAPARGIHSFGKTSLP